MINNRSFQGDLSLLSAVNLFQLIRLASLSGQLVVRCAENTTHFVFTEGKINYGFSQESRRRNGQALLGSIAVENGYLPQTQGLDIFSKQTREVLFETLTWTDANFSFVSNSPLSDEEIVLKEDIDSLIMKGLIFLDDSSAASSRMTQ